MSVCKMKTLSIISRNEQLDDVLSACVESKQFHPETTSNVVSGVTGFSASNEENPYRAPLNRLTELLKEFGIEPQDVDPRGIAAGDTDAFLTELQSKLLDTHEQKQALEKQAEEDRESLSQLEHFKELDVELDKVYSCRFVSVRFGRIPKDSYERLQQYQSRTLLFVPCSFDGSYYWGVYLCPHEQKESVDRIFASLFFERLHLKERTGTPAQAYQRVSEDLQRIDEEIKRSDFLINQYFAANYDRFMGMYSYLKHKNEAFELRRYCAGYKNDYALLIGWVPEDELERVIACIRRAAPDTELSVDDPKNMSKLTPPSKLKNKKLFRPFEMYVQMYGLPAYNEPDPTAFVAITYTVLFGIMFADLGQGLLLAVAGYLMWRLKRMPIGKILVPCGVSSAFFGTCFGSVFGFEHWLDPMFHLLGFQEKPIEVIDSAVYLLVAAIGIGVVLLIVAMVLNVVSSLKRRDLSSAVFGQNGIAGILLYSSLILLLLSAVFPLGLPKLLLPTVMVLCVVFIFLKEPLGKLLAGRKDWRPESWGDYALENFAELFEVLLSYFSNTVSFVRVGAFVLIHAGMMLMFTNLANAIGNPVGYAAIMVFGNLFVTVLEALLVSIQTLRLEFYEMFSRFYSGDGREYTPISAVNNEE